MDFHCPQTYPSWLCKEEREKGRVRITSLRLPQKIIHVNSNHTATHIQLARTHSWEYNLTAMEAVKCNLPLCLEKELCSGHSMVSVKYVTAPRPQE